MRSIFTRELRRRAVVLLALAAAPFLSGCSTLGIATTEELAATETRLQNSNRDTSARLDNLEQGTADMQQTLNQIATSIDTMNTRFGRAKTWLETMNLDTISQDAQAASKAALDVDSRHKAFLTGYLEWLKGQQALIEKQIAAVEGKMKETGGIPPKKPAGSGGDGGSKKTGPPRNAALTP